MRQKPPFHKLFACKKGVTVTELLLTFCLLTISLAPLYYLYTLTKKPPERSNAELLAVLLAQHVVEAIVASKISNPESLPPMTSEEPLVTHDGDVRSVSIYFRNLFGKFQGVSIEDDPVLYWAFKPYQCKLDTYYLEDQLYKVIAYISYQEENRQKRVYLERLLDQRIPYSSTPGETSP
ncbi:hypothetical protein HYY75_12265 [bacterium]|nr:hypothetical protein [bacterium]